MPVSLDITDGVALILVDHSPAGLDDRELAALKAVLGVAASDAGAVVLHGGDRTFFSGVDLQRAARTATRSADERTNQLRSLCRLVARMPTSVVAAIGGDASGSGYALAMACDARVIAKKAGLTPTEAHKGVLMGRRIDAQEALRTGLVDEVAEPCALLAQARELAITYATHKPRKRTQEYAKVP